MELYWYSLHMMDEECEERYVEHQTAQEIGILAIYIYIEPIWSQLDCRRSDLIAPSSKSNHTLSHESVAENVLR